MKHVILLLTLSLLASPARATTTLKATVNGMVCAFCAQGIEKRIAQMPATKAVLVDLRKKTVAVEARDGQTLDTESIRTEIVNAGYDVVKIETLSQSVDSLRAQLKDAK